MNIICGINLIGVFKTSKYFRQNLGLVSTIDKNGRRQYNEKDRFSFFYNSQYRTTIYAQGNIGTIRLYVDYYIKDNLIAVYYGDSFEEFVLDFDNELFRTKGIDFYLGSIIKKVEEDYETRKAEKELKKIEEKPAGDATKVLVNPGQVSYEDLKAYLEQKRSNRI